MTQIIMPLCVLPLERNTDNSQWNDFMRERSKYRKNYNNSTNPLPEKFRGKSPHMVNTLLTLEWSADNTLTLLNYMDATGDHPDWSDWDWDELAFFFYDTYRCLMEGGVK